MIKIKQTNEKENPLFNRKEIEIIVESKITPSYKETRALLSEKYSVPKENIKINYIKGKFGIQDFFIKANIYQTKEEKEKIEKKSKKEIEAEKAEELEKKPKEENKENNSEKTDEKPTENNSTQENAEQNNEKLEESTNKQEEEIKTEKKE